MKDFIKNSIKWSVSIAVITFVLAALFSIASNSILNGASWSFGLLVVLFIVLIGIFFDMLGIASTAADEKPFHSMAAKKVYGAKYAIRIIRNADRFASFCNDVIGDISGIISGTAATLVIIQLAHSYQIGNGTILEYGLNVALASLIAAVTVGGKAFGKSFAIRYARSIIFLVGKVLQFLEEKCHIVIIKEKRRKNKKALKVTKKRK
ncbi:CNNM domain-containing protein [Bacillus chungangensis]|uniref:CBS domain containing-hemolysin-like protein n=1 Tax=Bacillus chungangensis TaxID=587633 RepID=A0ABT9WPJ0_9BACI|nr:CNNM domain-containing protein [Bacillus chungangensis]MDQ0175130.1 CBS domain containing-hemolysin-like protein [Bacillus chungangensis]